MLIQQTLYIIGSNNTQTKFRQLKVDRTEPTELMVIDDKIEYSPKEIKAVIDKIEGRSSNLSGKSPTFGSNHGSYSTRVKPKASAHGLVGFVRLLEGYYLILITKRRKVAQIGYHTIYKVDDTSLIYIPNDDSDKTKSKDEQKYLRMFQNVDLSSNFYFSYSYDVTHTLQYNMAPFKESKVDGDEGHVCWEKKVNFKESDEKYVRRTRPNVRFVWNEYLMRGVDLHPEWQIHLVHGFISQANIAVYGLPIHLTLIARRSQKYAGTRFLKRGANFDGDVANEVETEQIVHDASVSSFKRGRFTSFVQMRGSVPSHWSQDVSKMVPKPLIVINSPDPFYTAAGIHFNQLLSRYGSPIFVLNLVKNRERRLHETTLSNEFISAIQYLNQFLPPQHSIRHISFDMACFNKMKEKNVMNKLSDIAYHCIKRTGVFKSWPSLLEGINPDMTEGGFRTTDGRIFQTGIVRTNCVDCLDRTNTAQFALGRSALGFQLHHLGVLKDPHLQFDTDTVRMLEELYEDHGDTLALQYGGSQLVHRIKTYRKIAPLSSHSRDILQTLSRYVSNTFSDADKQNAINVFLGVYIPHLCLSKNYPHVWDLVTDFYLHNQITVSRNLNRTSRPLSCWWEERVAAALPLPSDQVFKGVFQSGIYCVPSDQSNENNDGFYEQYKPYEFTVLDTTLYSHMLHTVKDFMPDFTTDFSPFKVRPYKRRASQTLETLRLSGSSLRSKLMFGSNPSISPAPTSIHSSPSPSETDSDEFADDDINFPSTRSDSADADSDSYVSLVDLPKLRTFESLLGSSETRYGKLFCEPSKDDMKLYQKYVKFGEDSGEYSYKRIGPLMDTTQDVSNDQMMNGPNHVPLESPLFSRKSFFKPSEDDSFVFKPLSDEDKRIYQEYVARGVRGALKPAPRDMCLYQSYVAGLKQPESCED